MNRTYRAIIGIDLALTSQHSAVILSQEDTHHHRSCKFAHSIAEFERLVAMVKKNAALQDSVFLMEPTGKLWMTLTAFLKSKGATVIIVKPSLSSEFRKMLSKHAKSDKIDALALAKILLTIPEVLTPANIPSPDFYLLRMLCNERLDLVEEKTKLIVKIGEYFRAIYPAIAEKIKPVHLLDKQWRSFLQYYLVPQKAKKLGLQGFMAILQKETRAKIDEKQCKAFFSHIEQSAELFSRLAQYNCAPFDCADVQEIVKRSIKHLEYLEKEIEHIEKKITVLYLKCDPNQVLEQLPGIGETLAPSIRALIGDIHRFKNLSKMRGYCGLTAKSKKSSKTTILGLQITKTAHSMLKRNLFLAARTAMFWDAELAAFAVRLLNRGKHFNKVAIAVAGKLIDRIHYLLIKEANGEIPRYQFRDEFGNAIDKKTARIRALALWKSYKKNKEGQMLYNQIA